MGLEEVRKEISNFLIDTSEQNPLKCNITIGYSDVFGISTLEMPVVRGIYQIPGEGIIYFNVEENPIEFDEMKFEDLEIILNCLKNDIIYS